MRIRYSRREALQSAPWIKDRRSDEIREAAAASSRYLMTGEAEAFALAVEYDARLVLLDDNQGRRKAKEIGLTVKGTVGILLEAKQEGLIDVIKPLLIQLRDNGMHLSESLINNALQEADEAD